VDRRDWIRVNLFTTFARVDLGYRQSNEIISAVDRCGCDHDGSAIPHTLLPANAGQSIAAGAYHTGACCGLRRESIPSNKLLYQFDRALLMLGRDGREQIHPLLGNPNASYANPNHDHRRNDCYEHRIFQQRAAGAVAPQTQDPSPPCHFTSNRPTPKKSEPPRTWRSRLRFFARKIVIPQVCRSHSLPTQPALCTTCGKNTVAIESQCRRIRPLRGRGHNSAASGTSATGWAPSSVLNMNGLLGNIQLARDGHRTIRERADPRPQMEEPVFLSGSSLRVRTLIRIAKICPSGS
jgi:hypothetical protein